MQRAEDVALALLNRAATLEVPDPVLGGFLPIAMPDFSPPWADDEPPERYLSVTASDNVPRWEAISGRSKIGQGILQIEVIWPRGKGTISVKAAAQKVMDHFFQGLRLNQGTASVKISRQPWHGSTIPAAAGTSLPISIPWVSSAVAAGVDGPGGVQPGQPGVGGPNPPHVQTAPSILWVVNHNLGYRPSATVLSPGGVEVFATIEHQSLNQFHVRFTAPAVGSVYFV